MKVKGLTIIFGFALLLSCKNSDSHETQAEVIRPIEGIDKDSIKVLLHEKFKRDTSIFERTVFLDYKKHSEYKKEYYKADSFYLRNYWVSNEFVPPVPAKENLVINSCKGILKTYVSISRLDRSYVLFANGYDDTKLTLTYVKDTVLTFPDLQGWVINYYKKVDCSNDRFVIDLHKNPYFYSTKIEIKVIDKTNDIQIWRMTQSNGQYNPIYGLKAPLSYALKLPILVIGNSQGLDSSYEGLDELNLEKLFND
jgi:hypothetical protein